MKRNYVIAPHRIVDEQLERVVYGTGDKVPLDDAVKYGLIDPPEPEPAPEPTHVVATARIVDEELGQTVIEVGDEVPIDAARELGVQGDEIAVEPAKPQRGSKRRKRQSEDRSKRPSEDRQRVNA